MTTHMRKGILAMAVGTMLAGGSVFAQSQSNSELDKNRAAPGATPAAQPGAAPAAAQPGAAAAGAQDAAAVDQAIQAEMKKIQQSPQGALDKLFVLAAGCGGQFEVAFAQQAQQKSQDPQVKQLAQQILQDHQQANQQLMPIAQALGVTLPKGLDSMHAQKLQTYAALESKDYDKKFVCHNNEVHAKDVEAFKTAAATAMNPQVKQFAAQTLPKLQEHHRMIRQVGVALGVVQGAEAMPAGGRVPADHGGGATPPTTPPGGSGTTPRPGGVTPGGGAPQ